MKTPPEQRDEYAGHILGQLEDYAYAWANENRQLLTAIPLATALKDVFMIGFRLKGTDNWDTTDTSKNRERNQILEALTLALMLGEAIGNQDVNHKYAQRIIPLMTDLRDLVNGVKPPANPESETGSAHIGKGCAQ